MNNEQTSGRSMTKRDRYALILGLVLGVLAGVLAIASLYAVGLVFLFFSFLLPLIVSLVARNRIMTLSLVPNVMMALVCLLFYVWIKMTSTMRGEGPLEVALAVLTIMVAALLPALAVSGVVKLIRRNRAERGSTAD